MGQIKEEIKLLEEEKETIQRLADQDKERVQEKIQELRDKCNHPSTWGDAYDSWCSECGRKML